MITVAQDRQYKYHTQNRKALSKLVERFLGDAMVCVNKADSQLSLTYIHLHIEEFKVPKPLTEHSKN